MTGVVLSRPASRVSGPRCRKSATRSLDFRKSGKPIVAYLEYGGDQEYYLATACDQGVPDAGRARSI